MNNINIVDFKPMKGYWFTSFLLEKIWRTRGCIKTTLDLGVTWSEVCVDDSEIRIGETIIDLSLVAPREIDRVVYYGGEDLVYEVIKSDEKGWFYKLKAIGLDRAPTLEINGIHMHRIKGVDPWTDSRLKVEAAKIREGDKVLDTCMGLGYTAILSGLRGAKMVYTVEIDENVIWVARHNPWSRGLENDNIHVVHGDIKDVIKEFPDNFFDKIIHDPPRYTHITGDLYGLGLYKELYRVLKPGGRLFHYTGEPRRHGAPSILKGIAERLRKAGFYPVFYHRRVQGFVAKKPLI